MLMQINQFFGDIILSRSQTIVSNSATNFSQDCLGAMELVTLLMAGVMHPVVQWYTQAVCAPLFEI